MHSPEQDLGSRARPIAGDGCLKAEALAGGGRGVMPGSVECFWTAGRAFGGWQEEATEPGATPYARYLVEVAGF